MNVGKSTLFNRLAPHAKSLTLDYEGVTRDAIADRVSWLGRSFELIDTGGLTEKGNDPLLSAVRVRTRACIDEAAVVIFVVDGLAGVMAEDREIAQWLRTHGKQVVLVVNKIDAKAAQDQYLDFFQLYHTRILSISAAHGEGIGELLEQVVAALPAEQEACDESEAAYRVVLIGRPNVGKSSLMNLLVNEERSIVSSMPGTTREPVSSCISFSRESLELTDTPGIRRQRAIEEEIESLMVKSAMRAIKGADIVLLLIDASHADIVNQELKLAFYAFADLYKALVIVVNKADLLDAEKQKALDEALLAYPQLTKKIELLKISCKTGKGLSSVLPTIQRVWERHSQRLPAAELTRVLVEGVERVPLMRNRQRLHIHHVEQIAITPITLKLRVNYPKFFEAAHKGYLERTLREQFDLVGVPIKFVLV
jgi:GTP-binding protein